MLLLEASGTKTNSAPAGNPLIVPAGVAITGCPAVLAAAWQFVSCHGGFPPGSGSIRQMPSTPSVCQKCPPGGVAGVVLFNQTPPRGVVMFCKTIIPSVGVCALL